MLVRVCVGGKEAFMSRERYERTIDAIILSTNDKKRAEQLLALFMKSAETVEVDKEFEKQILEAEAADDAKRVKAIKEEEK